MTPTPEQTKACKELDRAMKEQGITWEPTDYNKWSALVRQNIYPYIIPLPTVERCLALLKEWGWNRGELVFEPGQATFRIKQKKQNVSGPSYCYHEIKTDAPDIRTAAIKACVEAVQWK